MAPPARGPPGPLPVLSVVAPGPNYLRTRREVPGSPRALLRAVVEQVPAAELAQEAHYAAGALGLSGVAAEWLRARDLHGEDISAWMAAADRTRAYLSRSSGPADPVDVAERVAKAMARASTCSTCHTVYSEEGRPGLYLAAMGCDTRACLKCLRKRLKRTSERWGPLFAALPREGYRASFVTLTSTAPVVGRAAVMAYLRRLGRVIRGMREGEPRFGIAARSWVAGLRSLEVVPRPSGGFAHAHLVVFCRAFWPYGLFSARVEELRAKGERVAPADLGFRALCRAAGIGEVFQDDPMTTADEMDAAGLYMRKLERYLRKVEQDADESVADQASGAAALEGMPWAGRADIQETMRGVRLMESFGDARGVLCGPDKLHRTRDGAKCGRLVRHGIIDPNDPSTFSLLPGGVFEPDPGPEVTIDRRTLYRSDTLDTWNEWCDVPRLREWMSKPARKSTEK